MAVAKRRITEHQVNVDLPADVVAALDEFCERNRVPKKKVFELALRRLLSEQGAAVEGHPV